MSHAEETIVVGFDRSDGASLRAGGGEASARPAVRRLRLAPPALRLTGIAFEPPGPNLDPSVIARAAIEAVDRALGELGGELEGIEA